MSGSESQEHPNEKSTDKSGSSGNKSGSSPSGDKSGSSVGVSSEQKLD